MTTTSDTPDSTARRRIIQLPTCGALSDIAPFLRRLKQGDAEAADAASALTVRLWDQAERATSDEQRNRLLALRHELQQALATMESADPRALAAKASIVEGMFCEGEPPFMDELTGTLARGLEHLAEQLRREDGATCAGLVVDGAEVSGRG